MNSELEKLVAEHLKQLGLDCASSYSTYWVVAVLKGARPGPVVALRADMDALPVTDKRSSFRIENKNHLAWTKKSVLPMSAVTMGHTAILMGVAEVLASIRDRVEGTVVFIFQPAEEGLLLARKAVLLE